MKNQYIYIGAIILLLVGGFCGYKLKQCAEIVSTVITTDTIYEGYPIHDTFIVSKPINHETAKEVVRQVLVTNTDTVFIDYPEFKQTDKLTYEGLVINISDRGNCNGVIERKSTFTGELKERVITNTVTKNVSIPPPLLSLSVGASASFSNKWKAFDIGPAVGISIRKKYQALYSYGLNTSTHNITISTIIK
jgi:hypothetical protein